MCSPSPGVRPDRATGPIAVDEVHVPQRPRGIQWAVGLGADVGVQLVVTARRREDDPVQAVTDIEARDVGPSRADEPEGDRAPGASNSSKADRAGPGQVVGVDAPDGGDVRAGGGVRQRPVARQLVGLLPVLTPSLPVALAGDRAPAAAGTPRQPEGQRQVDPRLRDVGAAAVLLGSAGGEHDRLAGPGRARTVRRWSATGTPVSRSTRSGQ